MTDSQTPPVEAATAAEEWGEVDPALLTAVQALLVTLGKTFRAYQLYDENNPVRRRFSDQLKTELLGIWQQTDRLGLRVDEDRMYLGDKEVYKSESRNDSLAYSRATTAVLHTVRPRSPMSRTSGRRAPTSSAV